MTLALRFPIIFLYKNKKNSNKSITGAQDTNPIEHNIDMNIEYQNKITNFGKI
jgi:hypothetical protein